MKMTVSNKFLCDCKCDNCGKEFLNVKEDYCPSENPTMKVFLGFIDGVIDQIRVGYDFGDLCKGCQQELFSYIKDKYPKLEYVKEND